MKFSIVAAVCTFAVGAIAGAQVPGGYGRPAPPACLDQAKAEEIVNKFKSVLQNQTFEGLAPYDTTLSVLAEDYVEKSDSILSLISPNSTLGDNAAPATVGRVDWYNGVSKNPIPVVETHDILLSGKNIVWFWTFNGIGLSKYPVKGFNLFRIDDNFQIYEANIEFNSIAWGIDTFQLQQYCGAPPS